MLYKNRLNHPSPSNILSKFSQVLFFKKQEPLIINSFQMNKDNYQSPSSYLKRNYNCKTASNRTKIKSRIQHCFKEFDVTEVDQENTNSLKMKMTQIKKEILLMSNDNQKDKAAASRTQRRSRNPEEGLTEGLNRIRHKSKDVSKSKTLQLVEIKRLIEQPHIGNSYQTKEKEKEKEKDNTKPVVITTHLTTNSKVEPHHKRIQSQLDKKDIDEYSQQFDSIFNSNSNTKNRKKTRNRHLEKYENTYNPKKSLNTVNKYNTLFFY